MHLCFSSYWCLNFAQLLGSQKSNISIFLLLKGLIKIKKHLNPRKLVRQWRTTKAKSFNMHIIRKLLKKFKNHSENHFSSNSNKMFLASTENLTLLLPGSCCAGPNTNLPLNRPKMAERTIGSKGNIFWRTFDKLCNDMQVDRSALVVF